MAKEGHQSVLSAAYDWLLTDYDYDDLNSL